MRILITFIITLLSFNLYATPVETLQKRTRDRDNYAEASYSLHYGTHTPPGADYDIQYTINGDIIVNITVDDLGIIADIGKISCKDIKNIYEKKGQGFPTKRDRTDSPMYWFEYSKGMDALRTGPLKSEFKPIEGHCYAIAKSTSTRRTVAVFHINKILKNAIQIDDIEVFGRYKVAPETP